MSNIVKITPPSGRNFGPHKLHNAVVAGRPLAGFRVVGQMGGALVYDDGEVAVGGIYQGLDSGEGADCYVLIEKHQRPYFHIYPTLTEWYEGWHYWKRSDKCPGTTCDCQRETPYLHFHNCPGEHHTPDDIPNMPIEMLQSLLSIHPHDLPEYFTRSIPKTAERVRGKSPAWLKAFRSKGRAVFGRPEPATDLADSTIPF